ncbi:protein kinase domain-containing protein [Fusarium austroafricanum]|uniref:Protein kinase domain-containing protein n=1 Tax=Fusarium austroafricanum TaxID=2364996 RepID=A0A8H4P070_9HYPO|nr:protein kinase domain-containing protein [Fusarium austroafricanum]
MYSSTYSNHATSGIIAKHLAVNIRVNGCRFTIPISSNSFSNSPIALSLFRNILAKIIAGEDDDAEVWDYSEQVADVFLPEFQRLAPPVVHTGKLTLADLAPRGTFDCEYRVVNEEPLAVGITEQVPEMESCDEWNICKIQSATGVAFMTSFRRELA